MKFVNYLEQVTGVSMMHMLSSFMFVAFFIGVLWYVFKMDKKNVEEKSNLPFE